MSPGAPQDRGHLLAEITTRIIQLYKQYYGKGPTNGRTYWQQDVITVVLRGGFTPAERTLRETGHAGAVAEQRSKMHEGLHERFKREISELTGRDVIGFMSGIQQDPDMVAEVFVLAPEPDDRPGAGGTPETGPTRRSKPPIDPPQSALGPTNNGSPGLD
ncbi:MAG TPA: DUF2294 domain-containing protein [Solirubrobacteraceae bacterium]|nr:DUF2294 domain-containing protein [Solirubrobacteraceae bacterium]